MTKQPECPECEKLSSVQEESNKIGEFMDWMIDNTSMHICDFVEYDNGESMFTPSSHYTREKLLAEYFKIDLHKVELERRALLAYLQKVNA